MGIVLRGPIRLRSLRAKVVLELGSVHERSSGGHIFKGSKKCSFRVL